MVETKKRAFTRILLISNPASTNAKRLRRHILKLDKIFPEITEVINVRTSSEGREHNKKLILGKKELLGPSTLLCIAAGDGTVNLAIETLISEPGLTPSMRRTTVLPLWGGNANDLAHMLNGYWSYSSLKGLLRRGNIVKINPLHVTLEKDGKKQIRIAACYASFGATAFAANNINKPEHRKGRLIKIRGLRRLAEIKTVVRSFIDVPMFKIEENGSESEIYEYALINGSRIAKVERLPVRLTDNGFYLAKIYRKHPIVILYILQILRRRKFGRVTSNRRDFKLLEPTWLQLDGEVIKLARDTKVTIKLSKKPFFALSKRLPQ